MESKTPTIVIIDDSAEVRSLIRTRLTVAGLFEVVDEGADGTEAIGLAVRHKPTVILLDTSMPDMDGLEALPGILAVSPNTRVVVYSGFEEQGLAEKAREFGAAAFIQKSLPLDLLSDELFAVLDRDRATVEAVASAAASPQILTLLPDSFDDFPQNIDGDQTVLAEHLERFREVFEESAIGMATMTLTGNIVRANRALADLMLCHREELVGIDYGRLMCGRSRLLDEALTDVNKHFADLVHIEHELAGGSEPRKARASLSPVRDSAGQALYVFLQVQDITAQRAAEDELLESEARFRLLVEAVREYAIFMLSPEGIVVSWNAGAQRSKGYRSEDILGKHFRVFYPVDKQEEKHPEKELELALRDGSYQEEGWRIRQDGTRFWANVIITAIFDEAGKHLGFAKVTRDVTERHLADLNRDDAELALAQANASLESLNFKLRQAAADQSQFLAVTAHELRTPAAVLGGSAQTLARHWADLTPEEREGLFTGMEKSADRLQRLLSDLLTASSLEAESLQLVAAPTLLSGVLKAASEAARATYPEAQIVINQHPDLELQADAVRLAQIVDNLIVNALTHGASPVWIEVGAEGQMASIRISDSGSGVPSELRPRLFEKFSTGDNQGTGLGLFIVQELARAHGGAVYYEPPSAERRAGSFVLCIPLARRVIG